MRHKMSVMVEKLSHSRFFPRPTWRWDWSQKACRGFQLCSTTLCMLMRSDWHSNQFYTEALGSTTLLAKSPWWNLLGSQTWQEMPHWWTAWGEIKMRTWFLRVFVETMKNVLEIGSNFAGTTMKSTRLSPSEKDSPPMLPCDMLLQVDTPAHPITYYDEFSYLWYLLFTIFW